MTSSSIYSTAALETELPVEKHTDRLRIETVLLLENTRRKTLFGIASHDGNGRLCEYGTMIQLFIDDVNRRAAHLHTVSESLSLPVKSWKGRKEGGVDVENPVRKGPHQCGREQSHETGQTDDVDLVFLELFQYSPVERFSCVEGLVIDDDCGYSRLSCTLQTLRACSVTHHDPDSRIEPTLAYGIENGLKVTAPTGD
jgi:hypothetical protein